MKGTISTLEEWLRIHDRNRQNLSDREIVDRMLNDLKQKRELQKQQQIDDLTENLRIARV